MLTMCSVKCRVLVDGLAWLRWLEEAVKQSAVAQDIARQGVRASEGESADGPP